MSFGAHEMTYDEVWTLEAKVPEPHQIDLSIYISERSQWDKQQIRDRLEEANLAFVSCNVAINNVYVHRWRPSNPHLRVDDYRSDSKYFDGIREAAHKSKQINPIKLFYFENYINSFTSGPALPIAIYPDPQLEPAAFNTAWFPYQSAQRLRPIGNSYNEEAHEIGHIMLQAGHDHSGENNIMANDSEIRGLRFNKDQCEIIRRHPAIVNNLEEKIYPLFSTFYQTYSKNFYMTDWCSRNVLNLSRAFDHLFKLDNYQVSAVFAIHKNPDQSFFPLNARKAEFGWKFHAFLLVNGMVLDMDYGDKAEIVPIQLYLNIMFGEQVKDLIFQLRNPLDNKALTYQEVLKSFEDDHALSMTVSDLVAYGR